MDHAEVLKEEYVALRAEICQSIAKQHQILLAGYGLTSTIGGYIIGSDTVDWKALIVLPLILLAMVSLWAVECNRMVRASYYIGYVLWPKLSGNCDGWETWIRIRGGNEGDFRSRQNILQQVVVTLVPSVLTLGVMTVVLIDARQDHMWLAGLSVFALFLLTVWIAVYRQILRISDLGAVCPPETLAVRDA